MLRRIVKMILLTNLLALGPAAVFAQEFRSYTAIYDEAASFGRNSEKSEPVARIITLFHAGKVYSYISEIGEVTIFEPAHDRFTILNTTRKMTTVVPLDEVSHKLKLARNEVRKRIEELAQNGDKQNESLQAALQFQLDPQFEETYDEQTRTLTVKNPYLQYVARCADPESQKALSPEIVTAYLRYADWIRKLNYVLHPGPILPQSRLSLNESLLHRKLIPTELELKANLGRQIHLRVEHKIHWELSQEDRNFIGAWESMIRSRNVRNILLIRYQEAVLEGRSKKK